MFGLLHYFDVLTTHRDWAVQTGSAGDDKGAFATLCLAYKTCLESTMSARQAVALDIRACAVALGKTVDPSALDEGGTTNLAWATLAGLHEVLQAWMAGEASRAAMVSVLHTDDKSNKKMTPFAAACDSRRFGEGWATMPPAVLHTNWGLCAETLASMPECNPAHVTRLDEQLHYAISSQLAGVVTQWVADARVTPAMLRKFNWCWGKTHFANVASHSWTYVRRDGPGDKESAEFYKSAAICIGTSGKCLPTDLAYDSACQYVYAKHKGFTALHVAAQTGQLEVLQYWKRHFPVQWAAALPMKSAAGETAFDLVEEQTLDPMEDGSQAFSNPHIWDLTEHIIEPIMATQAKVRQMLKP